MAIDMMDVGKKVLVCEACQSREAVRDGGFIGPICGEQSCYRIAVQADEDWCDYYYGSSIYPDGKETEDKGQ